MSLKLPQKKPVLPKSPEALFYTLRKSDPDIKNPWSQQADMLRSYEESLNETDVALELPTGSGKTLIALLIAEFRRQTRNERVAYLCPTKQLARQVGRHAVAYGVPAVVLVGPQSDYDPHDFGDYATASKIAITTYSGVFNTHPKINSAQCLILDDAHAAENYVADMWSVTIRRDKYEALYSALIDIFATDLPESLVHAVREESPSPHERSAVGKVLQPHFWAKVGLVRDALSAGAAGTKLDFSWSMVREHLEACNLYLSWDEIVLRPFMPPSQTHRPFWNANQRVLAAGVQTRHLIGAVACR